MKPVLAITIGDFNGIGPEIAIKAASHSSVRSKCTPLLVGPLKVFEHTNTRLKLKAKLHKAAAMLPQQGPGIPVFDVGDAIGADVEFGRPTKASGKSAGVAIETAVNLCLEGKAAAMVTAPSSKEALNLAGYNFPGQTEMIGLLSRSARVAMMLVSKDLRVGLVTIHVPVRSITEHITADKIVEKMGVILESLRRDFAIADPKLAVLGLNPHAGEHGVIGSEEQSIILPALAQARAKGINAEGPFSADGFFGQKAFKRFDAVVAMYHDQGLIPLKMHSFGKAVNFSAGLTILRTSPDHGTAYDIAGKGKARLDSMLEAMKLALQIIRNRHD